MKQYFLPSATIMKTVILFSIPSSSATSYLRKWQHVNTLALQYPLWYWQRIILTHAQFTPASRNILQLHWGEKMVTLTLWFEISFLHHHLKSHPNMFTQTVPGQGQTLQQLWCYITSVQNTRRTCWPLLSDITEQNNELFTLLLLYTTFAWHL